MSLSPQAWLSHVDRESELFKADEFPWEEPALLFESLESLMMRRDLPSREELLAIDMLAPLSGKADFEEWDDFASDEY